MDKNFAVRILNNQNAVQKILRCNNISSEYGLTLSPSQAENLIKDRVDALKETSRIEFNGIILEKLIARFSDSPYIYQDNYEEILSELQSCFYHLKNESRDTVSDDELIDCMKHIFNDDANGSVDYLYDIISDKLQKRLNRR